MRYFALCLMMVMTTTPAFARERSLTVTQFDSIRIDGNYIVDVVTGRGPSAKISGSEQAIERTSILPQGQVLVIRTSPSAWGGAAYENVGPATIHLTTAELRAVNSSGSSSVKIDHMRSAAVIVAQNGSGAVTVASVEADTLDTAMTGAGSITLAGKVAQARATIRGAGVFDASALSVNDLRLVSDGSATVRAVAKRSANITAAGTGTVVVTGKAACIVVNKGAGSVACGH